MACTNEFIDYICELTRDAGEIAAKKMFGEYGLYLDGKFVALMCDNQFFLKDLPPCAALYPEAERVPPYQGGKPALRITDLEDRDRLCAALRGTWERTAYPRPRKKQDIN